MIGTGANPPFSAKAFEGAIDYGKKLMADPTYLNATVFIPPYVPGA
jgi:hypothetical protein